MIYNPQVICRWVDITLLRNDLAVLPTEIFNQEVRVKVSDPSNQPDMSWISPTLIWSNNNAKATSAICSFGPPIHYSWQGDESHGRINWMPGIHQTDVSDHKDIKDFFKPPLFADGIFKSIFFNENCCILIVITIEKWKGPNYLLNQLYPSLNAYVSSFGLGEFTFAAIFSPTL